MPLIPAFALFAAGSLAIMLVGRRFRRRLTPTDRRVLAIDEEHERLLKTDPTAADQFLEKASHDFEVGAQKEYEQLKTRARSNTSAAKEFAAVARRRTSELKRAAQLLSRSGRSAGDSADAAALDRAQAEVAADLRWVLDRLHDA